MTDQKAAFEFAANVLAPTGVNVIFFDSKGDSSLPNGFYREGTIYIDINAHMTETNKQTLIMYTVAHELTHLAEKLSPELWRRYADKVLEIMAERAGVDVPRFIREKMFEADKAAIDSMRRVYPRETDEQLGKRITKATPDSIRREMVANASQMVLTNESNFTDWGDFS